MIINSIIRIRTLKTRFLNFLTRGSLAKKGQRGMPDRTSFYPPRCWHNHPQSDHKSSLRHLTLLAQDTPTCPLISSKCMNYPAIPWDLVWLCDILLNFCRFPMNSSVQLDSHWFPLNFIDFLWFLVTFLISFSFPLISLDFLVICSSVLRFPSNH